MLWSNRRLAPWLIGIGWEAVPIHAWCYHHKYQILLEWPDHGLVGQ